MTAIAALQGTKAHDAAAVGHALAWLLRSYVVVITAFAHHHVPPKASTAAFAVTVVVVLFVYRGRRSAA
jgi:hypothetical protein